MKKGLVLFLFACSSLFAEEEKKEEIDISSYSYWDFHPLHTGGNVIALGGADVTETPEGGTLYFRKANAFIYMIVPISMTSFFLPRVEWNTFTMDWNKNQKFSTTQFYYTQFALTFYSRAIDKWTWILRADYNIDNKHFSSPGAYGLFSGLIWGSYQVHRKWHYHIGGYGYSGMRGGQVYPVIGVDFSPNKYWTFLIVFPIEYYVQYKLDDHWKFALRGRPMKERFRTGSNEAQPRSIFSYSSIGTELNAKYEIFLRLELEAWAGYNFGGDFYIKDSHGKNAMYTETGGSPYGGISLNWGI